MNRRALVSALVAGACMAFALALAGLTRPQVIIGWVDFFGQWDPTMLIFFAFGVLAYHLVFRWAGRREKAGLGPPLSLPTARAIDARLLVGASLFGIGWGLGGVCPGPGFTSLGAGAHWAVVYIVALGLGLLVGDRFRAAGGRQ